MIELKGIPASEGIVIGKCYLLDRSLKQIPKYSISEENIEPEKKRFMTAVEQATNYIEKVKQLSKSHLEEYHSFIFDVYLLLLKDEMLIGETCNLIGAEHINAEFALKKVSSGLIKKFQESDNEYFKERKSDLEHIVGKILNFMSDEKYESVLNVDEGVILIAHDLTPADVVQTVKKNVKAFATDLGGKTSHTSILARSLGIPAVVGLEDATYLISSGDIVIVDGTEGKLIIDPSDDVLIEYQDKENRFKLFTNELRELKDSKALTKDGVEINLLSNIELNYEIKVSNEYGSNGIGLYRTEYIYLENGNVSEEEQFEILKEAILMNGNKPIVIRTFDLGGEKISSDLPHNDEQNPVMGLRAIRYSLKYEDFFKKQLRAILRVATFGDVRLMFPMISGMEEINKVKELILKVSNDLTEENIKHRRDIPIGIMVEIPSLAIITHLAAKHVDFFSVGTNDLIQYLLGIDRNNEYVSYLYRPTHPSIITVLDKIVKDAEENGIDVTVCGEMAGDPLYIPVLLGLGYRNLSMSPALLLKAKMVLQKLEIKDCIELVEDLKNSLYAAESEEKLRKFYDKFLSQVDFH
jgi:phosphotransferase system enzyme I (PtsI)